MATSADTESLRRTTVPIADHPATAAEVTIAAAVRAAIKAAYLVSRSNIGPTQPTPNV